MNKGFFWTILAVLFSFPLLAALWSGLMIPTVLLAGLVTCCFVLSIESDSR